MPLKKAQGNMYSWVTHLWNPIVGCSHQCSYCYVKSMRGCRLPAIPELKTPFPSLGGKPKTIFVGHLCDMFAAAVPDEFILRVLLHCQEYPQNTYVFQTKNPARYFHFIELFSVNHILGTTIETNKEISAVSKAPSTFDRYMAMVGLSERLPKNSSFIRQIFITIEPIMDFNIDALSRWVINIKPAFVNIGADSKNHNLPEPPQSKIYDLVEELKAAGIEVRLKENLKRLFPW